MITVDVVRHRHFFQNFRCVFEVKMKSSDLAVEGAIPPALRVFFTTASDLQIARSEAESKTKSEERIGGNSQKNGAAEYLAFSLVSNIRTPSQKNFIKGGECILSY